MSSARFCYYHSSYLTSRLLEWARPSLWPPSAFIRAARGRRRRTALGAPPRAYGGLAALRRIRRGRADRPAQHHPGGPGRAHHDRGVSVRWKRDWTGADVRLSPLWAPVRWPGSASALHAALSSNSAPPEWKLPNRRRGFPGGPPRHRADVQHLRIRRLPDLAAVAAAAHIHRRPGAQRIGVPGLRPHPLQPRRLRRHAGRRRIC